MTEASWERSSLAQLMRSRLGVEYTRYAGSPRGLGVLTGLLKTSLERDTVSMARGSGLLRPPFDPFSVREIGRAKVRFLYKPESTMSVPARLLATTDGFDIEISDAYRANPPSVRARAIASHELMHTLFFDVSRLPPAPIGISDSSSKLALAEEDVCRHLSRCFLLPEDEVRRVVSSVPSCRTPGNNSLTYLTRHFDASREVISYRMIRDLNIWDAAYFKAESQDGGLKLTFRVKPRSKAFVDVRLPLRIETGDHRYGSLRSHLSNRTQGSWTERVYFGRRWFELESRLIADAPRSVSTFITRIQGSLDAERSHG